MRPNRHTQNSDIYRTHTPTLTSQKLTARRDAKVPMWPKGAIIWKVGSTTLLVLLLYKTLSTAALPTHIRWRVLNKQTTLYLKIHFNNYSNSQHRAASALLHVYSWLYVAAVALARYSVQTEAKIDKWKLPNKHFLKSKGGGSMSEISRVINLMHHNKWDQSIKPESLGTTLQKHGPHSCARMWFWSAHHPVKTRTGGSRGGLITRANVLLSTRLWQGCN